MGRRDKRNERRDLENAGRRYQEGAGREGQIMKGEIRFPRQVVKTLVNLRALRSIT